MAKKKPPVVEPVAPVVEPDPPVIAEPVDVPESKDRAPIAGENPRHAVLICEERGDVPRRVTARNPGEQSINIEGVIYHHTHEDKDGRWIYTRLRPA